jgi:5-methylcytosine-specific restriction endonuclease McrA
MSIPLSQSNNSAVLSRDNFTCQTCGATGAEVGGRELMRVGYLARNDESVKNSALDLKTLCPNCDEGFATAKLLPRMNAQELLVQVRRAAAADQIEVLKWLVKKYPRQGEND